MGTDGKIRPVHLDFSRAHCLPRRDNEFGSRFRTFARPSRRRSCATRHRLPRDSLHPLESAEICCARRVSNFPQLYACACSDFGAVDLDFIEVAAARMNHYTADSTVADKKIRSTTHCEKRQVFIPTKSNQIRKRLFIPQLDPKL